MVKKYMKRFFAGYLRIKVNGKEVERFFNLCISRNLALWNILPNEYGYECNISIKDFKNSKKIVKKCHALVSIKKRQGFPFILYKYRKRKFLIGITIISVLFFYQMLGHIWHIELKGNCRITDDMIFEYLDANSISYGMPKHSLNAKVLSDKIRTDFQNFTWVSVKTEGTDLEIEVKEEIEPQTQSKNIEQMEPSSLIASKNGIVHSIYVRGGRAMVHVGDVVEPGMILVSGELPVYDDNGTETKTLYTYADADVCIEYQINYKNSVNYLQKEKNYTGNQKNTIYLKIGKLRIGWPLSRKDYKKSDLLLEETQLCVFEHYYLPVYINKITEKNYQFQDTVYTKEEVKQILDTNFLNYAENLNEKGVQIFENDVKIKWNEKSAILAGSLLVGEFAAERIKLNVTEEEISTHEYG